MMRASWIALFCMNAAAFAGTADRARDEALAFNCYACHAGVRGSPVPDIRGWSAARLLAKLTAYKQDPDRAALMSRIAKGYGDEELQRIAAYLAVYDRRPGER